jgi:ATP-dependent Lhr-like helicase
MLVAKAAAPDVLELFLPAVADWFRGRFETPTPPQQLGWPVIAAKQNTLLIAPTGSGKTLAAFLACLDHLWRVPFKSARRGVRVLYISPLKALNVDIARNLLTPLTEILEIAASRKLPLEPLRLAVRTGDTPTAERQRIARRPPEILITTPESLHLMLTSRARTVLASVEFVVVDEIHALCGNKRGVFLSLLLERLEQVCVTSFVRIGLSATQRPLEEVARYLGGRALVSGRGSTACFKAREVTIVDAGSRKQLDLKVSMPSGIVPLGGSVWPAIEDRIYEEVCNHRSTIVFTNNRRSTERLAAAMNLRAAAGVIVADEADEPEQSEAEADGAVAVARPHHGSLSLASRQITEEALKRGDLRCVVATASLELGIDMGAVDLVCQVESPGGIGRGLQRVGRAGHVVGVSSRGRILAKTSADLLESAALARAMLAGEVEHLRVPVNCLDVLAQQVVACVAVDRWEAIDLFDLMRRSYCFRDLAGGAFESVLRMVSGRGVALDFRDFAARISWDVVHNTLHPLPGTAHLALVGGGTIPDTGRYPLYLGEGGTRLGELDEEFVLERRPGDTFRLGHGTWRIETIQSDRVVVSPAAGESALMPFWRGEAAGRTVELGEAVAELSRCLVSRIDRCRQDAIGWLQAECALDEDAAHLLVRYLSRQLAHAQGLPDDRTLVIESFIDSTGEVGLAVLCPLGSKINHAIKLILLAQIRDRLGIAAAALHGDDGVLVRLPGMEQPPLDLLDNVTGATAERHLREELSASALFGLRFRQNAGRALLMPRPDPGRRAPLWLQRLRARDLLQAVRGIADFPIVLETYRECLDDDLELPRVRALFDSIQQGETRVLKRHAETPSPFVSELLFHFTLTYLYEWDEPKRSDRPPDQVDDLLLNGLLTARDRDEVDIDPAAVARLEQSLRGLGRVPRGVEEMAEWLRRLGDIGSGELIGAMESMLEELECQGRAVRIELGTKLEPQRWICVEYLQLFREGFRLPGEEHLRSEVGQEPRLKALSEVLSRFVRSRALVGIDEIVARYPVEPAEVRDVLESIHEQGLLVRLDASRARPTQWAMRTNLVDARRLTIALRRRETVAVTPEVFSDYVARRQHVHAEARLEGEPLLPDILTSLEGFAASIEDWEADLLPRRLIGFRKQWLESQLVEGTWSAIGYPGSGRESARFAIVSAEFPGLIIDGQDPPNLDEQQNHVLAYLNDRGLCPVEQIAQGTGQSPSVTRIALRRLLHMGRVVADRLGAYRAKNDTMVDALTEARSITAASKLRGSRRRRTATAFERWSLPPGRVHRSVTQDNLREETLGSWGALLLERYGVLSREIIALDPWAPPWGELVAVLARAELRGELRRGYFVEGLSGVQFATGESAEGLASLAANESGRGSLELGTLLRATDPANLYGSNAPFDVPLLEGGTARLSRLSSNALVMMRGRPVLVIEAAGKRLTGLPSASESELRVALSRLPELCDASRRVLKVETYNCVQASLSPAAPWLGEVGFVRDYPGMVYYSRG